MNYTHDTDQYVFLKDADIVSSMAELNHAGATVSTNGIPSYTLFRERYNEVSGNISAVSADVLFLKTVDKLNMVYRCTLAKYEYEEGDSGHLSNFFMHTLGNDPEYLLKQGFTFGISASLKIYVDGKKNDKIFNAGDLLIMKNDVKVSNVQLSNIFAIYNAQSEVEELCSSISSTISRDFFHLSGDNSISGNNTFAGDLHIDLEHVTTSKVVNLTATTLSAESSILVNADVSSENVISSNVSQLTVAQATIENLSIDSSKTTIDGVSSLAEIDDALCSSIEEKIFIKNPDSSDLSDGAYSNLSVVKIARTEYFDKLSSGDLNDRTLYILSSNFIDAYGQVLSNVTMPGLTAESSSVAVNKAYVDELSTISKLSDEVAFSRIDATQEYISGANGLSAYARKLRSDVDELSGKTIDGISAYISGTIVPGISTDLSGKISAIHSYISGDNGLCSQISSIQNDWTNTFTVNSDSHISSNYTLKIFDQIARNPAIDDKHDQYAIVFLSGTLVLSSLN